MPPSSSEATAEKKARRAPVVVVDADGKSISLQLSKAGSAESKRIKQLLRFDQELCRKFDSESCIDLIGTDEVGRGCLAGPVVAAAVILDSGRQKRKISELLQDLDDSKKLKAEQRLRLSNLIRGNFEHAIAEASVAEIEELNILQASLLAMNRAVQKLNMSSEAILVVDGNQRISGLSMSQVLVVAGDSRSASIAAASVIAKVHRDELMHDLHREFPFYGWSSNKGYASLAHRQALTSHGLSPWHRKSFCRKIMQEQLKLELELTR